MPGRNRFIDLELQERSVPPPSFHHTDFEFVMLVQRCRMIYRNPMGGVGSALEKQLTRLVFMELKRSGYPLFCFIL